MSNSNLGSLMEDKSYSVRADSCLALLAHFLLAFFECILSRLFSFCVNELKNLLVVEKTDTFLVRNVTPQIK